MSCCLLLLRLGVLASCITCDMIMLFVLGTPKPVWEQTFRVARSCVPIATRERCLQRFWCSLSCRSMKLLYRAVSKLIPRKTAATAKGRTKAVSGLIVSCKGFLPACRHNFSYTPGIH